MSAARRTGGAAPLVPCPWCSAPVASDATRCPACGAALREPTNAGAEIPGVTEVDPALRSRRDRAPNRLLAWLSGDAEPAPAPSRDVPSAGPPASPAGSAGIELRGSPPDLGEATPDAYAPPSPDVRLEMVRIQLEARAAEIGTPGPQAVPAAAAPVGPGPDLAADSEAAATAADPPLSAAIAAEPPPATDPGGDDAGT